MWYYLDQSQQQQGPVEEGQLSTLISQGVITPQTYVWKQGMGDWVPFAQLQTTTGLPAADLATATCQVCQKPVGADNLIELAGVRVCAACKPVAIQTLSEGGQLGSGNVWRDGKKMVTHDGALFPARCLKCNASTSGPPLKRKLYWHSPFLYLLIFLHILIYLIVAIIVRKRATVEVYLCDEHRKRRMYFMLGAWAAAVIGFGLGIWGIASQQTIIGCVGGVFLIIAPVVGILGARATTTLKIKDKTVWLRGAGKEFLESLPIWNG